MILKNITWLDSREESRERRRRERDQSQPRSAPDMFTISIFIIFCYIYIVTMYFINEVYVNCITSLSPQALVRCSNGCATIQSWPGEGFKVISVLNNSASHFHQLGGNKETATNFCFELFCFLISPVSHQETPTRAQ